jgi:hypothetical protein
MNDRAPCARPRSMWSGDRGGEAPGDRPGLAAPGTPPGPGRDSRRWHPCRRRRTAVAHGTHDACITATSENPIRQLTAAREWIREHNTDYEPPWLVVVTVDRTAPSSSSSGTTRVNGCPCEVRDAVRRRRPGAGGDRGRRARTARVRAARDARVGPGSVRRAGLVCGHRVRHRRAARPMLFRSFEHKRSRKDLGAILGANARSLEATPGHG